MSTRRGSRSVFDGRAIRFIPDDYAPAMPDRNPDRRNDYNGQLPGRSVLATLWDEFAELVALAESEDPNPA